MGSVSNKNNIIFSCCSNKNLHQKDFNLEDKIYSSIHINKILKIQSAIRGFLIRKKIFLINDVYEKKEISLDYKTDAHENNPLIVRLNNLLPKLY